MGKPTKWVTETNDGHSQFYIDRFRQLAQEGADLAGEARLVDAMAAPGSTVLDAGCGTGRVGGEIARRGHHVVGVDADPELVAEASRNYPDQEWIVGDLTELNLVDSAGEQRIFAAAISPGNVLPFMAEGTQAQALSCLRAHVAPEGFALIGFGTGRGYEIETFDHDLDSAGWRLEWRFATWDLKPWTPAADFAVSVLRHR